MMNPNSLKIVFIGAGCSVFTMRLVGDILGEDSIRGGELVLVDLDEGRLSIVEEAVSELVRFSKRNFKVSACLDYKQAIPNADFVFMTIATGCYDRWKSDIEVCTRYGVLQSVGDTIGPGGIIRTLRTIPVILDIAHEMEKVCPDAWMINYTNPEGAVCLALQRYTKIKSFGLCHGTPSTARHLAKKVFGVDPSRFTYRAAGINHFTWFLQMEIDGKDVYPQLRQKLTESGCDVKEPISTELLDIYGYFPAPGDRHVGEFVPHYLRKDVLGERNLRTGNCDFAALDTDRAERQAQLDEVRINKTGHEEFMKGSGETATLFMRASDRRGREGDGERYKQRLH